MTRIVIYTRHDCHLCDEAKAAVARATAGLGVKVVKVDVDTDPALRERFGHEVPVVFIDDHKAFKFRVDEARLLRRLRRGA